MKLLVVVETLKGMPMAWSMARTLTAPEPMPSNPDSAPAPNINPKPAGTRCTKYGLTIEGWIYAVHAQARGQRIRVIVFGSLDGRPAGSIARVQEHQSEYDADGRGRHARRKEGSEQGPQGRRDFEKHPDTDVREAVFQVGHGRARRRGNHRDQRRPDRVTNVNLEHQGKQGDQNHAAAESRQRTQKSCHERSQSHQECELQIAHPASPSNSLP